MWTRCWYNHHLKRNVNSNLNSPLPSRTRTSNTEGSVQAQCSRDGRWEEAPGRGSWGRPALNTPGGSCCSFAWGHSVSVQQSTASCFQEATAPPASVFTYSIHKFTRGRCRLEQCHCKASPFILKENSSMERDEKCSVKLGAWVSMSTVTNSLLSLHVHFKAENSEELAWVLRHSTGLFQAVLHTLGTKHADQTVY